MQSTLCGSTSSLGTPATTPAAAAVPVAPLIFTLKGATASASMQSRSAPPVVPQYLGFGTTAAVTAPGSVNVVWRGFTGSSPGQYFNVSGGTSPANYFQVGGASGIMWPGGLPTTSAAPSPGAAPTAPHHVSVLQQPATATSRAGMLPPHTYGSGGTVGSNIVTASLLPLRAPAFGNPTATAPVATAGRPTFIQPSGVAPTWNVPMLSTDTPCVPAVMQAPVHSVAPIGSTVGVACTGDALVPPPKQPARLAVPHLPGIIAVPFALPGGLAALPGPSGGNARPPLKASSALRADVALPPSAYATPPSLGAVASTGTSSAAWAAVAPTQRTPSSGSPSSDSQSQAAAAAARATASVNVVGGGRGLDDTGVSV